MMKIYKTVKYLFLIFFILNISCNDKPKKIEEYSIEQFYKSESINVYDFSYDNNNLLITSNKTGIQNIYQLPIDGSESKRLTNSETKSLFAKSYFPNDNRVIFASDNEGDELNHLYLFTLKGKIKDLTPWENSKSEFIRWNHSKDGFYFKSTKRDPRYFDLYEMKINDFSYKLIYQNDNAYGIGPISNNHKYLALTKSFTMSKTQMYLLNLKTKEIKLFEEAKQNDSYLPQFFSDNNQYLYYLTNKGNEFRYIAKYNFETKESETIWKSQWDISYIYHSENKKYRVIAENNDAKTKIHVFDLVRNEEIQLPGLGNKNIVSVSISKDEKLFCLTANNSALPNDIYLYNPENYKLDKLTESLNPDINPEYLVQGENISFQSFDGLKIPGLLFKPQIASANNKVPVVLWIHGGPGGQTRLDYTLWNKPLFQYLVNKGYAVLAVNNRGSSGYGKTFFTLDDRKHGEDDLQDCIYAKRFLRQLDYINPSQIGIIGASYGGYMVMAALTFAPEEFKVGVNIFGVTNWIRTLRSIPPFWADFKASLYHELGNPYSIDSVRLKKISPLFHTENLKNPLMVLQGSNDPRVLQVESDEIVNKARKNQVPVEYVLFNDEGHGFRKMENEIKAYKSIVEFLNKYLKS